MNDGFAWSIIALMPVTGSPYSVSQTEPAECRKLCHERRPSSASAGHDAGSMTRPSEPSTSMADGPEIYVGNGEWHPLSQVASTNL